MRIDILSREYPPEVYGGAGVHVAELVRALRAVDSVDARAHSFGAPRDEMGTTGHPDPPGPAKANAAARTLRLDPGLAGPCEATHLVHPDTRHPILAAHPA